MSRIALFIDGAYLNFLLRDEFPGTTVDHAALFTRMTGGKELLRTYYYDCLPWRSEKSPEDDKERRARHQKFHEMLVWHVPQLQMKLGKLARRFEEGRVRFEQKQVDILLSVDLVQLAAKRLIGEAVLLAGDSDFLPAVEAAKQEGIIVHLYHGPNPHRDLVACCDRRVQIDAAFIESVRKRETRNVR